MLRAKHSTTLKQLAKILELLGLQKRLKQKYANVGTGGPKQNSQRTYPTVSTKDGNEEY